MLSGRRRCGAAILLCSALALSACSSVRSAPQTLQGASGSMVMPDAVSPEVDGSVEVLTLQRGTVRMLTNSSRTLLRMPNMEPFNGVPLPFVRNARRIDRIDGRRESNPVLLLSAQTRACPGGGHSVLVVPKGNELTIQEMGRCGRPMRLARSDGAVIAVDDTTLEIWAVRDGVLTRLRGPAGSNNPSNNASQPDRRVTQLAAPPVDIRTSIPEVGWATAP